MEGTKSGKMWSKAFLTLSLLGIHILRIIIGNLETLCGCAPKMSVDKFTSKIPHECPHIKLIKTDEG
jgi:hypothetical protein